MRWCLGTEKGVRHKPRQPEQSTDVGLLRILSVIKYIFIYLDHKKRSGKTECVGRNEKKNVVDSLGEKVEDPSPFGRAKGQGAQ